MKAKTSSKRNRSRDRKGRGLSPERKRRGPVFTLTREQVFRKCRAKKQASGEIGEHDVHGNSSLRPSSPQRGGFGAFGGVLGVWTALFGVWKGLFALKEGSVRWQRAVSLRAKRGVFDGKEGPL
jgi:hypothetical protein